MHQKGSCFVLSCWWLAPGKAGPRPGRQRPQLAVRKPGLDAKSPTSASWSPVPSSQGTFMRSPVGPFADVRQTPVVETARGSPRLQRCVDCGRTNRNGNTCPSHKRHHEWGKAQCWRCAQALGIVLARAGVSCSEEASPCPPGRWTTSGQGEAGRRGGVGKGEGGRTRHHETHAFIRVSSSCRCRGRAGRRGWVWAADDPQKWVTGR